MNDKVKNAIVDWCRYIIEREDSKLNKFEDLFDGEIIAQITSMVIKDGQHVIDPSEIIRDKNDPLKTFINFKLLKKGFE